MSNKTAKQTLTSPQEKTAAGRTPASNPTSRENLPWKKIAPWGALLVAGIIAISTLTTYELTGPIAAHLQALRIGDIDSAYQHTSPGFRTNTSLPAFERFVAAYPVLNKHTSFKVESSRSEGDKGEVTGYLFVDGERYSHIEFLMSKSGNSWKIQGIHIKSALISPVNAYLSALRAKSIRRAYEHTSNEFRANTDLSGFQKFVDNYPVLTSHTAFITDLADQQESRGRITGYLFWNNRKAAWVEFILVKENGNWKIYRMQLKKPEQEKK